MKVKAGDTIRLNKKGEDFASCPEGRENNATAVVQARMDDYAPGALCLRGDLRGCRFWNEEDVVVLKRA